LLRTQQHILVAALCIGFFGLCAIGGIFGTVRPATVTLGPEGIAICGGWKTRTFSWRDVSQFQIVAIRQVKLVGFDISPDCKGFERLRQINRATAGVDASLPAYLELSPDDMLSLVLAAQNKWGAI
jgi:hypothetical protein